MLDNLSSVPEAQHSVSDTQYQENVKEVTKEKKTRIESPKMRIQRNGSAPTREDIITFIETESVFDRSDSVSSSASHFYVGLSIDCKSWTRYLAT